MPRSLDTIVNSIVLGAALVLTGAAFAAGAADLADLGVKPAAATEQVIRLEPVTVTISRAAYDAARADAAQ